VFLSCPRPAAKQHYDGYDGDGDDHQAADLGRHGEDVCGGAGRVFGWPGQRGHDEHHANRGQCEQAVSSVAGWAVGMTYLMTGGHGQSFLLRW
jgi:hypothetical protein